MTLAPNSNKGTGQTKSCPGTTKEGVIDSQHSHEFVEKYDGLVGFGFDRQTDEQTVKVYLQKFSDDTLIEALIPRLEQSELSQIFSLISGLLRQHLNKEEYHALFLKETHDHHSQDAAP